MFSIFFEINFEGMHNNVNEFFFLPFSVSICDEIHEP